MFALEYFNRATQIASIEDALRSNDIIIKVSSDFNEYRRLRKPQLTQRPIYPMFDVGCSYIDEKNAFWIAGFKQSGELIHTQAMRFIELGDTTLDDHFQRQQLKYLTPNLVQNPENVRFEVLGGADLIKGKVCYHGDFWIAPLGRKEHSIEISNWLSRLILGLSDAVWKPDFVFALSSARNVFKGIAARLYYFHSVPGVWLDENDTVVSEEWLGWMTSSDIASLLRSPINQTARGVQAAISKKTTKSENAEIGKKQNFQSQMAVGE